MVVEKPRGKTPLKWATKIPDADMFNSRDPMGNEVLYPISPEALRDVFATNAYDFEKPYGLRAYMGQVIGEGLITIEGPEHKAQRKTMYPSFNIKHIRALYPIMWQKAGTFLDRLSEEMREHGKFDICEWSSRYSLDIIGRAALAREFDSLNMKESHVIAKSFSEVLEPGWPMLQSLMTHILLPPYICGLLHPEAVKMAKNVRQVLYKIAEELYDDEKTRAADGKSSDQTILGDMIRNDVLDRESTLDNMLTMIGAGHETSASSITWACHLLTLPENKHYQEKIREEARQAFPSTDGVANWNASAAELQAALETSPWLNGTCEEVLRLFPAVPATLREPIRQTTIAGTVVPKGQLIVIMPWAINRNPRYWGSNAEEFHPERWIDKMPDGSLRANRSGGAVSNFCEATFLHGPRACIGRDFAKAELKCALAAIFARFVLDRLPGDDGSKVRISGQVTIRPRGGLQVKVTPVPGW